MRGLGRASGAHAGHAAQCRSPLLAAVVDSDSGGISAKLNRMPPRLHSRPLAGFIEPCLPRPVDRPPIGGDWLHEIKHDGFRIMARRDAAGVRLLTRNGYDFAGRFPLAAAAVAALSARSCLIDGEAIVTDQKGLAVFDLIRAGRQPCAAAVLCAFDLLELDGEDLRREPIETRKSTLKSLLRGKHAGVAFNAHFIADGAIVYRQACALGCEGIVSKRLGSSYRSGRADCWVKVKNPAAPAVRRETEEDWN
jgi:bifunctional non-homologous end joining protein LigD